MDCDECIERLYAFLDTELTQTEITARLKQPLGTVKTRLRLALDRLREMVRPT